MVTRQYRARWDVMLDHDNLATPNICWEGVGVGRLTPVPVDLTSSLSVIGRVGQIRQRRFR
jgi:hypothetical protein